MMVVLEFYFNILKYLKEMKKYVSKLILHKNIIKWDDLKYVGTFQQYMGMALIFTHHIIFSLTTIEKSCQNLCLKSHLSESFDVPAGCERSLFFFKMAYGLK